jgi:hypothetical protein
MFTFGDNLEYGPIGAVLGFVCNAALVFTQHRSCGHPEAKLNHSPRLHLIGEWEDSDH